MLGIIYTYKLLLEHDVGPDSVGTSPRKLQNALKQAAKLQVCSYTFLFRCGIRCVSVASFQTVRSTH